MRYTNPNIDGTMDTTLGLIMRLNYLWTEADNFAKTGKYSSWNFTLDAIWRNLSFSEKLEVEDEENEQTGEKKIITVRLNDDDKRLWIKLNKNVIESLNRINNSKSKSELSSARRSYYSALQMKDIGLRKFQHGLKLYVKTKNKNTSNSMWGS
jgi:intergrase/recombinase